MDAVHPEEVPSGVSPMEEEHEAVKKADVMYDKYSGRSRRAIEKLNGTEIGGCEIKVNITEKRLQSPDLSLLQAEDSIL
ncbi:hypothetical protein ACOSQ2_024204 [Xanthoceras sorbifolium]